MSSYRIWVLTVESKPGSKIPQRIQEMKWLGMHVSMYIITTYDTVLRLIYKKV
jgi:hypothetical protein